MSEEKIAAAAIKIGTEVYTGMTHFAVMRRIVMMPDVASGTVAQMILDGVDGFVTDGGPFCGQGGGISDCRAGPADERSRVCGPGEKQSLLRHGRTELRFGSD